jgi:hypothetical protein
MLLIKQLEQIDFFKQKLTLCCKVGCKSLFNLVELIEIDAKLEQEFKMLGKAFERNEIVKIQILDKMHSCKHFHEISLNFYFKIELEFI